jgi:RNA polymerase sigma factor (sigma-70 family)
MEYAALLDKLSPTVRRIACKLSGPYSGLGADDLYQEAMLHLWNEYTGGTLDDKTDSYILQGCFFHLKNYIRTHRVRGACVSLEVLLGDEEEGARERVLSCDGPDPRTSLHAKMLYETLIHNGFTQREKDVLRLWREDLDTRGIGARLGISHVRVVKLMASIRRKCLAEYSEGR